MPYFGCNLAKCDCSCEILRGIKSVVSIYMFLRCSFINNLVSEIENAMERNKNNNKIKENLSYVKPLKMRYPKGRVNEYNNFDSILYILF